MYIHPGCSQRRSSSCRHAYAAASTAGRMYAYYITRRSGWGSEICRREQTIFHLPLCTPRCCRQPTFFLDGGGPSSLLYTYIPWANLSCSPSFDPLLFLSFFPRPPFPILTRPTPIPLPPSRTQIVKNCPLPLLPSDP